MHETVCTLKCIEKGKGRTMMDAEGLRRRFTKHDVVELLKITPSQAYAIIRQLQKDGKIELLYGGKYSKYRVVKQ